MMKHLALALAALLGSACGSTYAARDPTTLVFPSVTGTSLAGQETRLPEDLDRKPTVLLVGYKQNAQFDLDRWLIGLHQTDTRIPVFEVPTIPGLLPGLFAGRIDDGMRSGIPEEDWVSVITVYDDAEFIARFTGNENGNNGRVLLLDADGRVVFFHDRGFSVSALARLRSAISQTASVAGTRDGPMSPL